MSSNMNSTLRDTERPPCCPQTASELRRAYFAQAGEIAMRYGVRFERVLDHLGELRGVQPQHSIPVVRYLDDLIHAVACVDGVDLAWRDLTDRHERALIRACRHWLDATDAIVFVRKLLAGLRRDRELEVQKLRSFDGSCSLRRWLGDRIVGALNRSGSGLRPVRPPDLDQPSEAPVAEGSLFLRPPAAGRT
ncbi:MAG: hypothetical protein ACYTGF_11805 [Planctomycetota bacterium]|jgi:hypothetical protein